MIENKTADGVEVQVGDLVWVGPREQGKVWSVSDLRGKKRLVARGTPGLPDVAVGRTFHSLRALLESTLRGLDRQQTALVARHAELAAQLAQLGPSDAPSGGAA